MRYSNHDDLRIIIVKPGATELDEQGRIVGSLDVPLSESGEQQAKDAAAELAEIKLNAVYCSPSLAAQQTAVQLTLGTRIKVRIDANLKNMDHGLWHGKEINELQSNQPKLFRQWEENPASVCPPGGETTDELLPRVDSVLKTITRKHKTGTVVIVAPDPIASVIAGRIGSQQSPIMQSETQCGSHETLSLSSGLAF